VIPTVATVLQSWGRGAARAIFRSSYRGGGAPAFCGFYWRRLQSMMPGLFLEKSRTGPRAGQARLEEPADEFRLTGGSGFVENVRRVGTRRQLSDLEPRGGCGKPVSGDDFRKNACLGGGQPEPCGKAPDLGAEVGFGIDDEDGGGRLVEIEDGYGPVRGKRNDMREKRRAIFAATKLNGSTGMGLACFGRRRLARERTQARGERGGHGSKPPVLIPQAHLTPSEVLGLGVGEDDPAVTGQEKDGETGRRDRRAKRVRCCSRPGEEVLDRRSPLQMRREGFQEAPFRWFHPNRIGRSCKGQKCESIGCAHKTGDDKIDPSLWADKFIIILRGPEALGVGVRASPHLARSDAPRRRPERVVSVIRSGVCTSKAWINIVQCR
jgi:hypothetical protein